jgi:DNA polymerase (family X)
VIRVKRNVDKKDVIRHLETIAIYMELKGENPFKIQAFRKAARTIELDERTIEDIEDFTSLSGIGKGTGAIIQEFIENGNTDVLKSLKEEVPKGLIPLLQIPGLGGKTIAKLYQELGITNVNELKKACEDGSVSGLKGFGKKKEEKILAEIENLGSRPDRYALADMLPIVNWIEEQLTQFEGIEKYSRAGSVRRVRETVKDLDFIIATNHVHKVKEQLTQLPNIKEITNDGDTKVSIVFTFDVDVSADFRLVLPEQFATTLHHFTGSKDHNVRMRQIAKERNEKISEYGVEQLDSGEVLTFQSEEQFYRHFHLPWIPPEVRIDGTEIDRVDELDKLIAIDDIRGDLHMHTTWSDGAHSIEEMIEACRRKGYEYMAITDHSQNLRVANGLTPDRLKKQIDIIRELNEKYDDITILAGSEMDILPDGTLDFSDDILAELDFVIASIHTAFGQSQELIMKRLEAACRNPYVHMIAHPTGRKIGARDGYNVDVERLLQLAKETNTILELNANPRRLDLRTDFLIQAQKAGVHLMINTDSHQSMTLSYMEIGVKYARKAWIYKNTIVNTMTKDELFTCLSKKRA